MLKKYIQFARKKRRLLLITVSIGIIIILLLFISRTKPIEVTLTSVETNIVEKVVANTRAGSVKACRRAKLSPSAGGQIALLPIKEGDNVKAGQLLLELWNKDLAAQISLAKNEIVVANNQKKATCLQANLREREAKRSKNLWEKNAISKEKYDNLLTTAKTTAANCAAAQAAIKMHSAQLNIANALLEKTRLVAPFDGVVAEISAELNEYVTPSPIGIQTPPAIDLIDNHCFYVSAPIDEVDAPAVKLDMPVRISLDAFGDHYFTGIVRRIGAYVLDYEKQARTVNIEVSFNQAADYQKLLAGYSADVEVIVASHDNTLRIPTETIFDDNYVWVYQADNKIIQARQIKTGLSNWSYTEVIEGLNADDQIVLSIDREGLQSGVSVIVSE